MKTTAMKNVRTLPKLTARAAGAHKGDFGTVLIVVGSHGMFGVVVLCARTALRSGVGLARVMLPSALQPLLPLAVPEATTVVRTIGELRRQLGEVDAVVVGPGLSTHPTTQLLVQTILGAARVPVVLDADALNVLAPLRQRIASRAALVITPHPGEAARLLGCDAATVQADRMHALAELCHRSGGVVVLKGEGTLVADGARCYQNRTGNPGMATGGAGDVLSGLLGALLARGLEPFDAACLAVNVHGKAGDAVKKAIGENGLNASDLPMAIAEVLP